MSRTVTEQLQVQLADLNAKIAWAVKTGQPTEALRAERVELRAAIKASRA